MSYTDFLLAASMLGDSESARITNYPSDVELLMLQESYAKETLYLQAWPVFSSLLLLLIHKTGIIWVKGH